MSGNPFGLSEISHFGSFQRVGGKAGGFINKKFFHPSSIQNQEKLWKAQTADERERKKQNEMEKRREEERHVEEMRKQLYLAGQGKASDMFIRSDQNKVKEIAGSEDKDQMSAIREEKRRKAMIKVAAAAAARAAEEHSDDDDAPAAQPGERILVKSRYPEDKYVLGHSTIWGSWFSLEDKRWGFGCCKGTDHGTACPHAPEETPEEATKQEEKPKGKRKRQGEEQEDTAQPQEVGGLQGASASKKARAAEEDEPLMDMRMVEAAARRKQKKAEEEKVKEEAKRSAQSSYLNDLLHNPGASA